MKRIIFTLLFCLFTSIAFASTDKVMVQVRFTEHTDIGEYSDCLYFTPEDWAKLDPKDLESKKKERVDNWVNIVKNPPPEVVPTEADYLKEQASIDEQILQLQARKAEVSEKVAVLQAKPIEEAITE